LVVAMHIEYLPTFTKDLKKLRGTPAYQAVYAIAFEEVTAISDFREIPNLKKLKGEDAAYPIRAGDYRIGIFITSTTLTFSRVLHRREIYRYFP
jgi:mRNA interferase RelE/StbE